MDTDALKQDLEAAGLFNGETKNLGDLVVLLSILQKHDIKLSDIEIKEHTAEYTDSMDRFKSRVERIRQMNPKFAMTPTLKGNNTP